MKQYIKLVSTRGVLNSVEYLDDVDGSRDAAMAQVQAFRARWNANASHMIDGALTIVDTAELVDAAIDAEAVEWARFFGVTDAADIGHRRAVMRANVAVGYMRPLLPFLAAEAVQS